MPITNGIALLETPVTPNKEGTWGAVPTLSGVAVCSLIAITSVTCPQNGHLHTRAQIPMYVSDIMRIPVRCVPDVRAMELEARRPPPHHMGYSHVHARAMRIERTSIQSST